MNEMNTLDKRRHTLAHLLAKVIEDRYPHAKATIGPHIETGFYYDFDFGDGPVPGEQDLPKLTKAMRKLLPQWRSVSKETLTATEARGLFRDNEYKCELIDEIEAAGEPITLHTIGEGPVAFTDLCRGGHSHDPAGEIHPDSFRLSGIAGAYWRGDESRPMLTRIYGLAFTTPEELDQHLEKLEIARARDHRKLGKELDLFTFSDLVGPGLPLFTPKGTLIRDLIVDRIMTIQQEYGYDKVTIPHITKSDLYKTSGHWEKFGDELFKVTGAADTEFVMKPMNCPHHTQIFGSRPRSYKELPVRYAEATMVYRDEQHGELLGLSRVRSITQDDGHVFCREDQIETEVQNIVNVIRRFYNSLKMYGQEGCWVSLSVRDPGADDYLGDEKIWNNAEATLEKIAGSIDLPYRRVEGEAAFYGPKLDFMFADALGREWQLATAQLDFVMPERFGLQYTDENGEKQNPVMIHRAIAGSLERFMAIMIEHFAGAFPLWLAPEQIRIIPVSDSHHQYATQIADQLHTDGYRVTVANEAESMGKRIRSGKQAKIPYLLVIGDKEVEAKNLTAETRDGESRTLEYETLTKELEEQMQF